MTKKKTVLFIVQNNSFPFDKRVKKEADSLCRLGYNVMAISPVSDLDPLSHEVVDGIEVFRYSAPLSSGSKMGFITEYAVSLAKIYAIVIRLFLLRSIDAVHVANPPDFFWPLALLCRIFRVKFIFDQHDLAPEMFRIKFGGGRLYSFLLWNEKMTVQLANRIVVVNETFRERSQRLWHTESKKYAVVYNGPTEDFQPFRSEALIEKYRGKRIILYIGLMTVNDNIEVIIDVAREIVLDGGRTDCRFILVGGGEVEMGMKDRAIELGLKNYIDFTGIVDYHSVMEYLGIAEVCIAPDLPNGLNEYLTLIKILEYMKAGKPFVAFHLRETMMMAGGGGLFAANIAEYTKAILDLLDHPERGAALGAEGKNIVEKKYLWKFSEEILSGLYRDLWTS